MAVRWNSEYFTAMEHRDLQANAMAVDNTGTFVLLAGSVNKSYLNDSFSNFSLSVVDISLSEIWMI